MENQEVDNEIENENQESVETEASAETVETVEAAPVKRSRGRPLGTKVGPRERIWDCAAIVDEELIHVRVVAPEGSTPEQRGSFTREQAIAQFQEEYGAEPTSIHGPYFDQKSAQTVASTKKRETVSIAMPNLTSRRESAIFKDWRGMAYDIEGRDDVVLFMYGEEINPNPDKKRPVPQARTVYRSALRFEKSESTDNS